MNPMSMDCGSEIGSSGDRFDLSSLNDQVPFVRMALDGTEIRDTNVLKVLKYDSFLR